ncbi:putative rhamnogalacturonate lyase C [Paramyrothecium foliicola]|nr:putative rhamnogalacturonate lyase C [Paramyrothecium foliicola]
MVRETNAPLKLVIAGNHEFSLDIPTFRQKKAEAERQAGEALREEFAREYGWEGAARELLQEAEKEHIVFLDEGTRQFQLKNGASSKIFASPHTPSTGGEWGFQYHGAHDFVIEESTNIVITHGPPHGILDRAKIGESWKSVGSPQLFRSVATSQPMLHCFGHVHSGWGAKLVTWRPQISERPSHIQDIDNSKSTVLESLGRLKANDHETLDEKFNREDRLGRYWDQGYCGTSHCSGDASPLVPGQTLFVNAAMVGEDGELSQLPWIVDLDLKICG